MLFSKVLQQAGIKLSGVLSDIVGVSGRAILAALCAGEHDPERLALLVHKSVAHKHAQFVEALTGDLRSHHQFLLCELLSLLQGVERSIKHVKLEIQQRLTPQEERLERLEKITGISRHPSHLLYAEVGLDLSRFPDAALLASWAGICPGHKESAGKRQSGQNPSIHAKESMLPPLVRPRGEAFFASPTRTALRTLCVSTHPRI